MDDDTSLVGRANDGHLPRYVIVAIVACSLFCVVWSPALIKKIYELIRHRAHSRTIALRRATEREQRRIAREARRDYISNVLITKRVYVKENSQRSFNTDNSEDDRDRCAICLVGYSNGNETCVSPNASCKHQYCKRCIMKWLMKNDDCPICRRPFLSLSMEDMLEDPTEASTPESSERPPSTIDLEQPSNAVLSSPTLEDSSVESLSVASAASEPSLALPNYRPLSDDESCSTGIGSTSSLPRRRQWLFGTKRRKRRMSIAARNGVRDADENSDSSIESSGVERPSQFQWMLPFQRNESSASSESDIEDDAHSASSVPLPIKWTNFAARPRLNSDPGYSTSDANEKRGPESSFSSSDDDEEQEGLEIDYFPEIFLTNCFSDQIDADIMGTEFPKEFNAV